MKIELWAVNYENPVTSLDGWLGRIRAHVRATSADAVMIPEYACAQWVQFKPRYVKKSGEVEWLGKQASAIWEPLKALSAETGVAILAGTAPAKAAHGWKNRATFVLPSGRLHTQDKIMLMPSERDPAAWCLRPGNTVQPFAWKGKTCAIVICRDSANPMVQSDLTRVKPDLIFLPSMTRTEHMVDGNSWIFGHGEKLARELGCDVVCVGGIGECGGDPNWGGAAHYSSGHTVQEIGPFEHTKNKAGECLTVTLKDGKMPLKPGKSHIGENIRELEKPSKHAPEGRAYRQALAIALKTAGVPKKRADGGSVDDSAFTGGLDGDTPGRADALPVTVPDGAHVIPADVVSSLGGGNTGAGLKHLGKMFPKVKTRAAKAPAMHLPRLPVAPHLLAPKISMPKPRAMRAAGGGVRGVKCALSDGEFVVHPEHVKRIGEGDAERGHRALDHWIVSTRKQDIEHRKRLPGPVQS